MLLGALLADGKSLHKVESAARNASFPEENESWGLKMMVVALRAYRFG